MKKNLDVFSLSGRWQQLIGVLNQLSKSTLFRILKKGKSIKANTIEPFLTEKNKKDRVEFCLLKIFPERKFVDSKNYIHIDEKWFYLFMTVRSRWNSKNKKNTYYKAKIIVKYLKILNQLLIKLL